MIFFKKHLLKFSVFFVVMLCANSALATHNYEEERILDLKAKTFQPASFGAGGGSGFD